MVQDARPHPRRAISIALRMTVWYALTAFSLIFVATGVLYWVLVTNLYQENVRDLADNLNNARLLLGSSPSVRLLQPPARRPSWAPPHQPEIYLRVLDQEAQTLVETPGMSDELPPPARAELAAIRTPDGEKREVTSQSGTPFLELIVRVPGQNSTEFPRFMQVAMDREHEEYLLSRYRDRLWLVLTFSLVVCSVVGFLIAKGGMRPITHISHTAERISSTTLHERIAAPGLPTELSGLAETFNSMLDRLEESFLHISQFSDDVAHELRTPINNLHGEIEVALSKARSGEYYREILGSCLEECTRISRLIQSLLFLARTGSAAEALQRNHIDVGKELATVREFYEAAAAEAGVDLQVSTGDDLSAHVDRTLFQQAIGNLVSNSIAHTPPGGTVQIAAHASNDGLTVSVSDTGCGIAAEHLPYVFERFYRADRARSSAGHNVGLGLAVVKSIAVRHGGRVEIDSEIGRGRR
jgi:two-component system heavy metal sensor histidine kinase CusS